MPNTDRYSSSTNPDTSAGTGIRLARNSRVGVAMVGVAATWCSRNSTRGSSLDHRETEMEVWGEGRGGGRGEGGGGEVLTVSWWPAAPECR